MDGLSDRRSLCGIHDATMKMPGSMKTEEIAILRNNHPPFSMGSLHMRGIGGAKETCFTHCLDINALLA